MGLVLVLAWPLIVAVGALGALRTALARRRAAGTVIATVASEAGWTLAFRAPGPPPFALERRAIAALRWRELHGITGALWDIAIMLRNGTVVRYIVEPRPDEPDPFGAQLAMLAALRGDGVAIRHHQHERLRVLTPPNLLAGLAWTATIALVASRHCR